MLGETDENKAFAKATLERFSNPYIRHLWKSISLNSVSKFTARVLPTALDYIEEKNDPPKPLIFALACLIEYYKTEDVTDDEYAVSFIKEKSIDEILGNEKLWGVNLSSMVLLVRESMDKLHSLGIREALTWAMN